MKYNFYYYRSISDNKITVNGLISGLFHFETKDGGGLDISMFNNHIQLAFQLPGYKWTPGLTKIRISSSII